MDKVSIVVPVFNSIGTLERCISSIISQTFEQLEIILVDDGSQDGSLSICNKLASEDTRIKVIHQNNAGVSSARNAGIQESTGKWLMFVDSDDWIESNTIEYMIGLMKKEDASYSAFSMVNEYVAAKSFLCVDDNCYTPYDVIAKFLTIKNLEAIICSVCNKIYKRSIITENKIEFENGIKFGEDFIFNSKVIPYVNKIVTTSKVFYHYDCTIENSGVKKLYPEWNKYIETMDFAIQQLCKLLGMEIECSYKFRQNFITNRWKYAFDVCLNSNVCLEKKSEIICNWLNSMPNEMNKWETFSNSKIEKLLEKKCQHSLSYKEITRYIEGIMKNQKKGEPILIIKQFMRKIIGK